MNTWFRRLVRPVCLLSWAFVAVDAGSYGAEKYRKRAPLLSGLPPYRYGHDVPRLRGSMMASNMMEEQVVQVLDNPAFEIYGGTKELPGQGVAMPAAESVTFAGAAPLATANTPPATGSAASQATGAGTAASPQTSAGAAATSGAPPTGGTATFRPAQRVSDQTIVASQNRARRATAVRRRRFAAQPDPLDVGAVRLSRVGLAIYETGRAACTGTLMHSGGPNGLAAGNYVILHVRGLGRNPIKGPVASGPMLFEFTQTVWVGKGEARTMSLIPTDQCELIRRHFDETTDIEVEVEVLNRDVTNPNGGT